MTNNGSPNSVGMAVGELKGLVSGLSTMLTQQNIAAAANRDEMMKFLRSTYDALQAHIKDDTLIAQAVVQLTNWQADAAKKVEKLWDSQNNQKGFIAALIGISSLISAAIMAVIEYYKGK